MMPSFEWLWCWDGSFTLWVLFHERFIKHTNIIFTVCQSVLSVSEQLSDWCYSTAHGYWWWQCITKCVNYAPWWSAGELCHIWWLSLSAKHRNESDCAKKKTLFTLIYFQTLQRTVWKAGPPSIRQYFLSPHSSLQVLKCTNFFWFTQLWNSTVTDLSSHRKFNNDIIAMDY